MVDERVVIHLRHKPADIAIPEKEGQPSVHDFERANRKAEWIWWLVIGVWGGFLALYVLELSRYRPEGEEAAYILLYLLGSFYLSVIVHETGHIVAALSVGFRFVYSNMGPLKISRELGGWKLRYNGGGIRDLGGNAYCVPLRPGNLRRRYCWFIAGGPLASLLQIGVLFGLRLIWQDQPAYVEIVSWLMLAPLMMLPLNILPVPGWDNDAQHFLRHWETPELFGRDEAAKMLNGASVAGVRPSAYPVEWLAEMLTPADGSIREAIGHFYQYTHLLDKGDAAGAAAALDSCLDIGETAPSDKVWAGCLLEAAYFEAWYGRDGQTARAWLKLAKQYPDYWDKVEMRQILWRVEATVLLAEGKQVQGVVAAQESLKLLDQFTNIGDALAEKAMLEEILAYSRSLPREQKGDAAYSGAAATETGWAIWK